MSRRPWLAIEVAEKPGPEPGVAFELRRQMVMATADNPEPFVAAAQLAAMVLAITMDATPGPETAVVIRFNLRTGGPGGQSRAEVDIWRGEGPRPAPPQEGPDGRPVH